MADQADLRIWCSGGRLCWNVRFTTGPGGPDPAGREEGGNTLAKLGESRLQVLHAHRALGVHLVDALALLEVAECVAGEHDWLHAINLQVGEVHVEEGCLQFEFGKIRR